MIRLARKQVHPIGLDIGHDSVKMIQLERVGDGLSVLAAARAPLPPEARAQPQLRLPLAVEVIRQMLRAGAFRGRKVVAALPQGVLHIRNLRLAQMPLAELAPAVAREAQGILPIDVSEAQVQFLPAGEVRQGGKVHQEVIVLAARDGEISEFLQTLGRAGVELAALDVGPCAIYRSVDRFAFSADDRQKVQVLVDVGWQRSQVVIGRGGEISFIKNIEVGGRRFQEAIGRKLGITCEEAEALRRRLVDPVGGAAVVQERDPVRQAANGATRGAMEDLQREIALCLRYFSITFRRQKPTKVRLVGGQASDPQLLSILNQFLMVPVEVAKPLLHVDCGGMHPDDRRGPMAEWAMALGLALKCVEGTLMPRDGNQREPLVGCDGPAAGMVEAADAHPIATREAAYV